METLFDTSVYFQKERPTEPTKEQLTSFYKEMANEIVQSNFSESSKTDIIKDLKKLYPFYDDGFEMAKELESYHSNAHYNINSSFIEWLEDLPFKLSKIVDDNVKEWVKSHNPSAKFAKGQKIKVENRICNRFKIGDIIYIINIHSASASYILDMNPNNNGGLIIPFEVVESNCILIE